MALYKYLHPERIDVLENLQIRFTQPSVLNDPFESLPMIEKLLEEDDFFKMLDEHVSEDELRETVEETLAKELNPYQGLLDVEYFQSKEFVDLIMNNFQEISRPFLEEAFNPRNLSDLEYSKGFKESFSNTFGILSLTQNPDNLLMWSHYCESHKGFLIEFEKDSPFFDQQINENDTIRKLKKIKYVDKRPRIDTFLDLNKAKREDYLQELINYFFLIKSDIWEYERELRMVLPLENADNVIALENGEKVHLFNLPPEIIKSVVFGSQVSFDLESRIESILNRSHFSKVSVNRAKLDMNSYKINIVNA